MNIVIWSSIVLILIILLLIALLYQVFKFLIVNKNVFGETLEVRLIGLGITTIFVKEGVLALFVTPLRALFTVAVSGFDVLRRLDVEDRYVDKTLAEMFYSIIFNLSNIVQAFPLKPFLLAIACWTLLGQFIAASSRSVDPSAKVLFSALPIGVRKNLFLGLIFFVGVYLSLAAIIAVPWLQEKTTEPVAGTTLAAFRAKLENVGTIQLDTTSLTRSNAVYNLDQYFQPLNDVKIKHARLESDRGQFIANAKRIFGDLGKSHDRVRRQILNHRLVLIKATEGDLGLVLSTYESELTNLKGKERTRYGDELMEWYKAGIEYRMAHFENLRVSFVLNETKLISEFENVRRSTQSWGERYSVVDTITSAGDISNQSILLADAFPMNIPYNEISTYDFNDFGGPPEAPSPGETWGIFQTLASWLFATDSMALVLITGVIGFGLFGSSISTFVREFENRNVPSSGETAQVDVQHTVIRGISASVVIFLGVEGGLAIFTIDRINPNPYVLFFSCMVGAVFSEQIWQWAKTKLTENFNSDPDPAPSGDQGNSTSPVDEQQTKP